MNYEFTRKKIATERRKMVLGWLVVTSLSAAGLAFGISTSDITDVFGMLRASIIGVIIGGIGYALSLVFIWGNHER